MGMMILCRVCDAILSRDLRTILEDVGWTEEKSVYE
jgi:hypothetical protein